MAAMSVWRDLRDEADVVRGWWWARRPAPWLPNRVRRRVIAGLFPEIHAAFGDPPTWKSPTALRVEAALWGWGGWRDLADRCRRAAAAIDNETAPVVVDEETMTVAGVPSPAVLARWLSNHNYVTVQRADTGWVTVVHGPPPPPPPMRARLRDLNVLREPADGEPTPPREEP